TFYWGHDKRSAIPAVQPAATGRWGNCWSENCRLPPGPLSERGLRAAVRRCRCATWRRWSNGSAGAASNGIGARRDTGDKEAQAVLSAKVIAGDSRERCCYPGACVIEAVAASAL